MNYTLDSMVTMLRLRLEDKNKVLSPMFLIETLELAELEAAVLLNINLLATQFILTWLCCFFCAYSFDFQLSTRLLFYLMSFFTFTLSTLDG